MTALAGGSSGQKARFRGRRCIENARALLPAVTLMAGTLGFSPPMQADRRRTAELCPPYQIQIFKQPLTFPRRIAPETCSPPSR